MTALVTITLDEDKIRACPDADESLIKRWTPFKGTQIKVLLPPLRASQIPGLKSRCDTLFWRVHDEDRDRIRPNDLCEGRWVCEHNLDID